MKKLLILLFVSVLAISCKDDDESIEYSEALGYLTNLTSVEYGVLGKWKAVNKEVYYEYKPGGVTCRIDAPDYEHPMCGKYEVFKKDGVFYLREYRTNDFEGTDAYQNFKIVKLDKGYLYLIWGENDEYRHTRVIE